MEKDMIFFGEQGLTSTSAGHVANMAKEYIAGLEEFVNNLEFYSTDIELLVSNQEKTLTRGNTKDDLGKIDAALTSIAEAKSLIAWLREAMKAKDKMTSQLSSLAIDTWCRETGRVYPEFPLTENYTEEMEIGKMSVKERNNYFKLQTYAAVYGKLIHTDGRLSIARAGLANILIHPTNLEGNGRDGILYSYSPTVTQGELETTFFELQKQQRAYQAEFNKMAHTIKENVYAEQQKRFAEQAAKYQKHRMAIEELNIEFKKYVESEVKKISDLKIIIPNDLTSIYNTVQSLGKSE
jgi:hypothetical protein